MKKMITILSLVFLSSTVFVASKTGDSFDGAAWLILTCSASNSSDFQAIEIYGTINSEDGITLNNVTAIVTGSAGTLTSKDRKVTFLGCKNLAAR